jgi:hypothetical protein
VLPTPTWPGRHIKGLSDAAEQQGLQVYQITNITCDTQQLTRFDVLYGAPTIQPVWAFKIGDKITIDGMWK